MNCQIVLFAPPHSTLVEKGLGLALNWRDLSLYKKVWERLTNINTLVVKALKWNFVANSLALMKFYRETKYWRYLQFLSYVSSRRRRKTTWTRKMNNLAKSCIFVKDMVDIQLIFRHNTVKSWKQELHSQISWQSLYAGYPMILIV